MNKLVDEYNKTYHRSIGKNSIHADSSSLPEEFKSSYKAAKFKVGDRVRVITFLARFTLKNGQNKYLWLMLCWKLTGSF